MHNDLTRCQFSMNPDFVSSDSQPNASLQPDWQRQVDAWRALLAQCSVKPSRKRIHTLRSHTLRLRALLEFAQQEQVLDSKATRAFKRWKQEAKKLRRVLQPVRDADVYLFKLGYLCDPLARANSVRSRLNPICLREIDALERGLNKQRQARIGTLMSVLNVRRKRLNQLTKEMEVALAAGLSSGLRVTAEAALQAYAGMATEFPHLNGSNLHEYRKHLKQVLYLAEFSLKGDPKAEPLAARFRKIHKASGDWHDWQALVGEAAHFLPARDKQNGLLPVLEVIAMRALRKAIRLCQHSANQSVKNEGENLPPHRRKPVAPESDCHSCYDDLSLGMSC